MMSPPVTVDDAIAPTRRKERSEVVGGDDGGAEDLVAARRNIEEERSRIKGKYRELIDLLAKKEDEVVENGEEEGEEDHDVFKMVAKEANDLFENVHNADEAVLDAKVMKNLAVVCRRRVEGFSTNVQTFRMFEYADKLVNCMYGKREEGEDGQEVVTIHPKRWIMLGQAVKACFARAPFVNYVYGAFEEEEIVGKVKQRRERVRVNVADLVVTKSTQLTQATDPENQTEVLVESTHKQLVAEYRRGGKKEIGYFQFVIDPNSFGATVENMFHTSFLIKEGKAKISLDQETRLPMIEPLRAKDLPTNPDGRPADKKQVVMSMSMQEWEDLKSALNIKTAMLNHGDLAAQMGKRLKST